MRQLTGDAKESNADSTAALGQSSVSKQSVRHGALPQSVRNQDGCRARGSGRQPVVVHRRKVLPELQPHAAPCAQGPGTGELVGVPDTTRRNGEEAQERHEHRLRRKEGDRLHHGWMGTDRPYRRLEWNRAEGRNAWLFCARPGGLVLGAGRVKWPTVAWCVLSLSCERATGGMAVSSGQASAAPQDRSATAVTDTATVGGYRVEILDRDGACAVRFEGT